MRSKQLGFTLVELAITVVGVGVVGLLVAGVWVMAHFIGKFW
jgi:Tfp pilus assembly protein PilE